MFLAGPVWRHRDAGQQLYVTSPLLICKRVEHLTNPVCCLQDSCGGIVMLAKSSTSPHGFISAKHIKLLTHPVFCLQDLCGGNVMLAKSSTSPHGFTAKVGDFGLARINRDSSAAAGAAGTNGAAAKHPVDQRLGGGNEYG
jgi:hypothetical protein